MKKLLPFFVLFLLMSSPAVALDIVIDPGHNGSEQNRAGPAFEVDFIGSQLSESVDTGDIIIKVDSTFHFSEDMFTTIRIDTEIRQIDLIDRSVNEIRLDQSLDMAHPVGTAVTIDNFLIQSIGQPKSLSSISESFDTIAYTHTRDAATWDDWQFMDLTENDGDTIITEQGLLEFKNTWEISTKLKSKLEALGHTVTLTKSSEMENVTFQNRGTTVNQPDIFVSVHTNGHNFQSFPDITGGAEWVRYRSSPDGSSPSHSFSPTWFASLDTSVDPPEFNAAAAVANGTPVLLPDVQYFAEFDKEADLVDPKPVRYRVFGNTADTFVLNSSQSDVVEDTNPFNNSSDRQRRGLTYASSFTPTDTGVHALEVRGPFQDDEQDSLGLILRDQLIADGVPGSARSAKQLNLALGSWVADVSDDHEPAFSLIEVGFHTDQDFVEYFVQGGSDSSAESLATAIDSYAPASQNSKFAAGNDEPHPFEVAETALAVKVKRQENGAQVFKDFRLTITKGDSTFFDTAPGNKLLITGFDTGVYSGTVAQVNREAISCPSDWDQFYETADTTSFDLTTFDDTPVIRKNFPVYRQSRFSGTVLNASDSSFMQDATVKLIPEGNNDTQVTTPNAPPPGQENGSYHFCGVDATTVDPDPPSSYTITASKPGFIGDTITGLTIASDTKVRVDTLVLTPRKGVIAGTTVHSVSLDGIFAQDVLIKDSSGVVVDDPSIGSGDERGQFTSIPLDSDTYMIFATKMNATVYLDTTVEVFVPMGDTVELNVPMDGYNDIRVTVKKQSNMSAAQGVTVELFKEGMKIDEGNTDFSGVARFRDLEPFKKYTVSVDPGTSDSIDPLPVSDFPDGEGDPDDEDNECGTQDDCEDLNVLFDDT